MKPIARAPTSHPNDQYCAICHAPGVIVVLQGNGVCHYCGWQINLCDHCAARASSEFALVLSECLIEHLKTQSKLSESPNGQPERQS